ncbi:MAG: polysaccharide biosynthesis/export family protein [Victivallaceae bacterium]
MKKYSLYLFICLIGMVVGCSTPVFAPRTIPNRYSVVPQLRNDNDEDLTEELLKLHVKDEEPYRITAGDQFNISVYEHAELGQLQIVVTPDGFISVPLVGPVKIGGLTLVEATDLLKTKFSEYIRNPLISLIPVNINGYNFTIAGRVNYPGCYPISIGKTRLVDAVALARGLAQGLFHGDTVELADLDNAYIVRDKKILPVNFKKALLDGDSLNNIPLRNNDYIYIPSTMNSNVIILGEVGQPTYVGYKEGLTILQALPFARGVNDRHSPDVKIIRGGMQNPIVYTINLQEIFMGRAMDFRLQPNDIVFVPKDNLSDWNVVVSKIVPTMQAINLLAGPFGNAGGYMSLGN